MFPTTYCRHLEDNVSLYVAIILYNNIVLYTYHAVLLWWPQYFIYDTQDLVCYNNHKIELVRVNLSTIPMTFDIRLKEKTNKISFLWVYQTLNVIIENRLKSLSLFISIVISGFGKLGQFKSISIMFIKSPISKYTTFHTRAFNSFSDTLNIT